jgi:hypothetical protein
MSKKIKSRRCFLCCSKPASLAIQIFYTNNGLPITDKTAQVRAKPSICEDCAKERFNEATLVIIVDDYLQCFLKIVELAANSEMRKNALLLYRSKKHQGKIDNLKENMTKSECLSELK